MDLREEEKEKENESTQRHERGVSFRQHFRVQ